MDTSHKNMFNNSNIPEPEIKIIFREETDLEKFKRPSIIRRDNKEYYCKNGEWIRFRIIS